MMIKNFGSQVENAWKSLRPMTKELIVGILKPGKKPLRKPGSHYDPHADWEISRLLDALDEQAVAEGNAKTLREINELNRLAEVCAGVLAEKTESAEIFIQLAKRALKRNDYVKIDKLADALYKRFTASEVAEIIRQTDVPQIKAICYETLAVSPTAAIAPLIEDPLYFEIACNVLEQQFVEFENAEAGRILDKMSPNFDF